MSSRATGRVSPLASEREFHCHKMGPDAFGATRQAWWHSRISGASSNPWRPRRGRTWTLQAPPHHLMGYMSSRSGTPWLIVAFLLAACSPGDGQSQQGGGISTGGQPAVSPGSGGSTSAGPSGGSGGSAGAGGGAQVGGAGGSPGGGAGGLAGGAGGANASGGNGTAGTGGAAPADAGAGGEVAPGASLCPEGPFPAPQAGA